LQKDICLTGHAIECRIYAEDPDAGFLPATGSVQVFQQAEGPGLRFDHGIVEGQSVGSAFDPMLGKLIAYGDTRKQAIDRAVAALHQTVILGVTTNIDFLSRVLQQPAFATGKTDTGFIEQHENELIAPPASNDQLSVLVAAVALAARSPGERRYDLPEPLASFGSWRN
jgi:propionyl-CoA carboxylase alpha chain/3-methylcrotonyl-CoA carboxylase alpha subunit/acetyl-CoA/propionyl-CoA carboxylase biotin carboxyl carrier protein